MKKDIFISPEASIIEAFKKLNQTALKVLLVVNEKKHLLGTLTDGDIRRYLLKHGTLEGKVKDVYNKNPIKLFENYSIEEAKKLFIVHRIEVIPIVNAKNQVKDYLVWNEILEKKRSFHYEKFDIDLPLVIMAGGKGTRLSPFTQIFPKPLIPVKNKTMIEHVIDHFKNFGIKKFILTINYKAELIKTYFESISKDYEIVFVKEPEYLGTAGSLKLIEPLLDSKIFFLSNCDIIVKTNLKKVLELHLKEKAILTTVTAIKAYSIPYGVINVGKNGVIKKIVEKPEYIFQINTGVYLLNKEVLKYIKNNERLDMPELMERLLKDGQKLIAYPVGEENYIDMGQWEEYKRALKHLENLIE